MAKIDKWIIDKVLDATRIEDVIGDFVDLRKAGVNLTGLCPFHDDHSVGNFIVRPSNIPAARHGNTYRCFACEAKGDAVKFLMAHERLSFPDAIRWLGKKYNIEVDDVPFNYTPPPPKPTPPPPPALVIPRSWVKRTMEIDYSRNLFTYWFWMLPWNDEQRDRIKDTLWLYCVGGWKDGRVVFWQIDHNGIPRAAKLMKYLTDGHRDKQSHPGWIYNQAVCRDKCKPDEHTILKPLFGAHLLAKYPEAAVNIVESEKTALIMANYYGGFDRQIWLACGGLSHMTLDAMQPLIDQGRQVWLWPDKDGVEHWQQVVDKLGCDKIQIYTRYFDSCWTEDDGPKADIADIAIRMMRTGETPRKQEEKHEPVKIGDIITKMVDTTQPFLDPDEMADPRTRLLRETLRKRYNFNKTKNNGRTTIQPTEQPPCDGSNETQQDGCGAVGTDSQA